MRNILATSTAPSLSWRKTLGTAALGVSLTLSTLWGVWATRSLLALEKRQVVTVQLSRIMGDFVEAEARSGRPPEQTRGEVEAYLKAVQASVERLGRDGRTVLVAEAVVAGGVPDMTDKVRADVARRMGDLARAAR
ncbi:type-F conjugative transfer system protein TrbI [Novosphingobium sp.]|uniref:type-F conjugative transfer system protein TrbI n=1 Tax=Novosphingobium sp. TaxID=1874826 RepID=UPI003BAD3D23